MADPSVPTPPQPLLSPAGWPTETCIDCRKAVIVAHYIDGLPLRMDAEPATDGQAVLTGESGARPVALFGIDDEAAAEFWQVPFDSDRYDRHECTRGAA